MRSINTKTSGKSTEGVKSALKERKEELEIKVKGVEKQEKQLQGLYERLRQELNEAVQAG